MTFSGALKLTDLNDYITPSQACIKPVTESKSGTTNPPPGGGASAEILVDSSGSYYQVTPHNVSDPVSTKLQPAQVNLNDCLACSGCITSAESVLINLQSHTEVLRFLSNNSVSSDHYRVPVVSISPQSLASISASLSKGSASPLPHSRVLRRLESFFVESLGFAQVFDTTFARELALNDHVREFKERRAQAVNGSTNSLPMLASACPGWICYAEKTHSELLPFIARTKSPQQVMGTLVKEWLGSKYGLRPNDIYHVTVMPCYDKKLEASRSDFYQDVYSTRDVDCVITTGELRLLLNEKDWDLSMPVPREMDAAPPSLPPLSKNGSTWSGTVQFPELLHHPGSSSGSYLHTIIHQLQRESDALNTEISTKMVRNADYMEYTLRRCDSGAIMFKGAVCYGFRNLQNVVRKIGREKGLAVSTGAAGKLASNGRTTAMRARANQALLAARRQRNGHEGVEVPGDIDRPYDYVEVMACPSGCVNGGGQLPKPKDGILDVPFPPDSPPDSKVEGEAQPELEKQPPISENPFDARWGDKEWTKVVEDVYWAGYPPTRSHDRRSRDQVEGMEALILEDFAAKAAGGNGKQPSSSPSAYHFLRTDYHAVEMEVNGLTVEW